MINEHQINKNDRDSGTKEPLPAFSDVCAAEKRLVGNAIKTPLIESQYLNQQIGCRLFVKAESLQNTGSFKFRGAFNRLIQLNSTARSRGVVAYSSGNHGQAVAAAANLLNVSSTIIMPNDAPQIKINGTERQGAKIIKYDRNSENREEIAYNISLQNGSTLIRPYEDFDVIAGQGTIGLEIVTDCQKLGIYPDLVVVPAGGGGLMAGCALAIKTTMPDTLLFTAEPSDYDDHSRSFRKGERQEVRDLKVKSLCDALLAPKPGVNTFSINKSRVAGGVSASDEEVMNAMSAAFQHLKLVIEPGGAVALAAILSGKISVSGKTVIAIASGGNVDSNVFQKALNQTY